MTTSEHVLMTGVKRDPKLNEMNAKPQASPKNEAPTIKIQVPDKGQKAKVEEISMNTSAPMGASAPMKESTKETGQKFGKVNLNKL